MFILYNDFQPIREINLFKNNDESAGGGHSMTNMSESEALNPPLSPHGQLKYNEWLI